MLDHAFRLSSNWSYFSKECDRHTATVSPVFVSQKIERDLKMREAKPPLSTSNVFFTDLNKTCAMHVMLVTHLVTYTIELGNTKTQVHPSANTFVLNILQHLKILVIILAF